MRLLILPVRSIVHGVLQPTRHYSGHFSRTPQKHLPDAPQPAQTSNNPPAEPGGSERGRSKRRVYGPLTSGSVNHLKMALWLKQAELVVRRRCHRVLGGANTQDEAEWRWSGAYCKVADRCRIS